MGLIGRWVKRRLIGGWMRMGLIGGWVRRDLNCGPGGVWGAEEGFRWWVSERGFNGLEGV